MTTTSSTNGPSTVHGPVRPEHLTALVASVISESREAIGVFAPGAWSGGDHLAVGDQEMPVVRCASPLAVREVLDRHDRDGGVPPVLLVPFAESALGWDVTIRLARRGLLAIEPWDVVSDLFRARRVDPRIVSEGWMADVLMAGAPADGYPPVAGDVLSAETAWSHVLGRLLGVRGQRPDVDALLAASVETGFDARYLQRPDADRAATQAYVERVAGPLAGLLMAAVEAGHGTLLLGLGLACDVLFPEDAPGGPDLDRAAVRAELYVGGSTLDTQMGVQWAAAARRVTSRLSGAEQERVFAGARTVLETVRADTYVGVSEILPEGYDRRLDRFGVALADALDGRGSAREVESALERVEAHRRALHDEEAVRLDRLRMATRLIRFLELPTPSRPRTLSECASAYAQGGSFVDWARTLLMGGDRDAGLSSVLGVLSERVRETREQENQTFATQLAAWNESPGPTGSLLPIETVLAEVVAPIAQETAVLVLVLDGMSLPSFRQLRPQILDRGWQEWTWSETADRAYALAVSPCVTRLSRTSLLSGRLAEGVGRDEAKAFASARVLSKASGKSRPVLFHKGDLQEGPTSTLAPTVRAALADASQRVVGVVLNVLDDSLSKSDQQLPVWRVDRIPLLGALLEEARTAGRAVVALSDHGHVLESDGTALPGDGQERWRPYAPPVADEEVVLSGPRIEAAAGADRIVVPWSERVRYVRKKAGYHGGATPQEMMVPAAVFVPSGKALPAGGGFRETPPAWWTAPKPEPESVPARSPRSSTSKGPRTAQPTLFGESPGESAPPREWGDLLLHTDTYAAQRALAGRSAPRDSDTAAILGILEREQGRTTTTALASALERDDPEVQTLLAGLQRVLNVDGHPVLRYDLANGHVQLDLDLASQQFGVTVP